MAERKKQSVKNIILLSVLLVHLLTPALSYAAEPSAPKILTRTIKVVDQDGKPIAGAMIDAWSINGGYFWPTQTLERKPCKTQVDGSAALRYPEVADYEILKLPVEMIKVSVYHPDYCSQEVEVPVGSEHNAAFEVQLSPGISLTLNAVDIDGKPVTEPFAVAMPGAYYISRWNRPKPSQAHGRFIKPGNQQLMLFQPKPDGRHLFSEVLSFHFDEDKEPAVVVDEIELQPGIRLRGRLADSVPRPVKNGYVLAAHCPLPLGNTYSDQFPSLIYYATAEIEADGSFEFKSMPLTGTVQLIALCDQWVGPKADDSTFIVGQTFDVESDKDSIVLNMERTFDAKIRVLDEQGQPVEGIGLVSTPNQLYKNGGSTILGMRRQTADMLKCQIGDEYDPSLFVLNLRRFRAVSDQQGKLIIRNLPNNRSSTNFECWSTDRASVEIKSNESLAGGRLPRNNEYEVEFDVKVEVIRRKSESTPAK